ncbi:MAG: HNH endonuclease [Pseudomonadota bacterium]
MQLWATINDQELIDNTALVVKKEKALTMQVLAHLQEMNRRKLFAVLGYGSLFEYCVKSLKYSESETHHRIQVMKLIYGSETAKKAMEEGKLNLTAASMIQKHIKDEEKDIQRKLTPQEKEQRILPVLGLGKRELLPLLDQMRTLPPKRTYKIELSEDIYKKFEAFRKKKGFHTDSEIINLALEKLLADEPEKPLRQTTRVAKVDTRYIAAQVKRDIQTRAGCQCEYISPLTGIRCQEKRHLEFDHIQPFSLSGTSAVQNIRLLCKGHNQRAAIEIFGLPAMQKYLNRH